MTAVSAATSNDVFPFPAIRVPQIARMSEKQLGDLQLTGELAEELSQDEIGILIGNCREMREIHTKLRSLASTEYPSAFVVVLQSRRMAAKWYNEQAAETGWPRVTESHPPRLWRMGCCWFTTHEGLQSLADSGELTEPVAAILMVDPYLNTHQCRGFGRSRRTRSHDRPQLVLNFRSEQIQDGRLPALYFLTVPPAKSLNTRPAESAYGLATWWYADGRQLRVGRPPQIDHSPEQD